MSPTKLQLRAETGGQAYTMLLNFQLGRTQQHSNNRLANQRTQ